MKLRFKPRLSLQTYSVIAVIAASVGLLLYRLVSLTPSMQIYVEQRLPTITGALASIYKSPIELPSALSRLIITTFVPSSGIGSNRLPSVLLGFVLVLLAYWLLRKWYGYRLAMFGTILLACSAWFLHASRLGTNDIAYPLSMTLLLVLIALWHQSTWSKKLFYITAVSVALLLYMPGFVFLILGVVFFERRNIFKNIKANKRHAAIALLLGLLLLAPLIRFMVIDWHRYTYILGYVGAMPSILDYVKEYFLTWKYIFIGGYNDPLRNVGSLPIIDIFMTVASFVGIYLYSTHLKAARTRQIIWLWLIGTALIALPGGIPLSLILPIVVVLATGGIGYLLHLWLKVFPRNPLARSFGIGLIGIVIAFSVAYNLRSYFVAWPNNPTTRSAFTQQP
ncbi:hypothetical protein BH09PAT3_BH09PAT3_2230 [soil metagenome]